MKKLIICDVDHTLLGDEGALNEFKEIIKNCHQKIGFAVATGRTIQSAVKVLKENNVLMPDLIISSVGSEIYYNYKGDLVYSKGWDAHISNQWQRDRIVNLLNQFDFLQYQEEEVQSKFKVSYYTNDVPEQLELIKETLIKDKLKTNAIFSHGQYLDILPYRASKGKAIRYLCYRWNLAYENILVAGDSGNDLEMLKGELLGIVVANYSSELDILRGSKRIYFADRACAGGIVEGIEFYNFLNFRKEDDFD
ncbi:MAG TPA: HAD-IIB family hydrolase [Ignavibacteria bacterium]|nr:HAD-IIB family hydrolase [Ignavibacteria bacterium]